MKIPDMIRPNIRNLKPYSSARNEHKENNGIMLDANENSLGSVLEPELNRYPDPLQQQLKQTIRALNDIDTNKIFIGNGSDEAIDLLIRAFCQPGHEKIVVFPPTYGVYSVFAAMNDISVISIPLTRTLDLDTETYKQKYSEKVKITFICNPNNPTGNCFKTEDIEVILNYSKTLIVIDEAYIDFAEQKSLINMLDNYPNMVILQTLSKAWGLAGIRIGMAYASAEIISVLNKIKYPYNINRITQQLAIKALKNNRRKDSFVSDILIERKILEQELLKLKLVKKIYPSQANFLLVKFTDAQKTYHYLRQKKIVVRDRSNQVHCENCLRITVGTNQENQILIKTLTELDK